MRHILLRLRLLVVFLVLGLLVSLPSQGQEKTDNPFRNAKVGDYVAYRATTTFMGKEIESIIKQTVSRKTESELMVTIDSGKKLAGSYMVDLTKPFDLMASLIPGKKKFMFEKRAEGKEKIKLGDNTYDCIWLSGKIIDEFNGNKLESDFKVWYARSVPLAGMVKVEIKNNLATIQMQLAGSGNEK